MLEPKPPIEILLVEDNLADVRLVQEALKDAKLLNRVFAVPDGQEALAFLRREGSYTDAVRPDLIFLDLKPAQEGWPRGLGGNQGRSGLKAHPGGDPHQFWSRG